MTVRPRLLAAGDLLPHFEVVDIAGRRVAYSSIWQHRHLVLVRVAQADLEDAGRRAALESYLALDAPDAACLVTSQEIAGTPQRGVMIADRWGEVAHVRAVPDGALPAAGILADWLDHLRTRCPECEGEAR